MDTAVRQVSAEWRRRTGGLGLLGPDPGRAALAALAAAVGTAIFIVILDCWMFRAQLPAGYAGLYTSPLWPRLPKTCAETTLEDLKYRLLLMTALMAGAVAILKRPPSAPLVLAIAVVVQFANIGVLVLVYPLYATLRYWAVGTTWGWLYWRHGLLAAMAAHAGTHLFLDPILLIGLR
jgi:hypothetical protein